MEPVDVDQRPAIEGAPEGLLGCAGVATRLGQAALVGGELEGPVVLGGLTEVHVAIAAAGDAVVHAAHHVHVHQHDLAVLQLKLVVLLLLSQYLLVLLTDLGHLC